MCTHMHMHAHTHIHTVEDPSTYGCDLSAPLPKMSPYPSSPIKPTLIISFHTLRLNMDTPTTPTPPPLEIVPFHSIPP